MDFLTGSAASDRILGLEIAGIIVVAVGIYWLVVSLKND